jgi:AraC-like DNA-binding protein
MSACEDLNRRLLRARDAIDRDFAAPLDVRALATVAFMSPAHFSRSFRVTFGETPHRYLQRRRVERAMALLRDTATPVTEVAFAVGFASLGTFSRTFAEIVGESPSRYRRRSVAVPVPTCFVRGWTRRAAFAGDVPGSGGRLSSFGEATP